jgi:drug/metabolite transporter (DMT)-like permease
MAIAVTGVLVKEALARGGQPGTLLTVRYVMAGATLGLPLLLVGLFPRSSRAVVLALAIGIAMWLGGSFEFEALSRVPLSVVIVILFISPLWVALHSRIVRREQLGWQRHAAFAAVFTGVVLLVGPALGDYDLLGLACALGSSFVWAGILILIDEGGSVEGFSPLIAIGAGTAVAGLIALAFHPTAIETELGDQQRTLYVLGIGLTAALSFGLLALGMRGHHVFDVIVVSASEPLFAVVLGAAILDETLKAAQLLGVFLVALGVVLIARAQAPPRPAITL